MKSVRTVWLEAQSLLVDSLKLEPSEARLEAQLLLQTSLNVNRAWLLAHENDALQANTHAAFEVLLKRRLNGEPIAYILGKREFYGLDFIVTPDTLIPRPDTETLVEAALEKIPLKPSFPRKRESSPIKSLDSRFRGNDELSVLDLGTGTGAIAIAIASQRPQTQVTATDVSPAALAVAHQNALCLLTPRPLRERGWGEGRNRREGAIANLRLIQSDWFSALDGKLFDVIVSNPPYIAENDPHLAQGDLRFEPASALSAGKDGLDCIRVIISQAKEHLKPQGWLLLEHGYDQAGRVAELIKNAGFDSITAVADLSGILRVTLGNRN